MSKHPKFRIQKDERGAMRVFLLAGNGHVLLRSVDSFGLRGNADRWFEAMPKSPKYAILPDTDDDDALRIFVSNGNGQVLFKTDDSYVKKGNADRSLERIKAAATEAQLEEDD